MSTNPSLPVAPPLLTHALPAAPAKPSIADRVARVFPPLACVRGYRYFARQRISLSNVSEDGLDAEVKGTRTQHVSLRAEGGAIAATCTCSAKTLGPATCRHVWGTLLEIDRQGLFASLRGSQRAIALSALAAAPTKSEKANASKSEKTNAPKSGKASATKSEKDGATRSKKPPSPRRKAS